MTVDPNIVALAAGIVSVGITFAVTYIKRNKLKNALIKSKDIIKFASDKMADGDLSAADVVAIMVEIAKTV